MNKRHVGFYISRNSVTSSTREDVESWFRSEHRDMCEWMEENVKDKWKIEMTSYGAVDMSEDLLDFFGAMTAIEVSIMYEDERDAVLHKLRWE